MVERRIRMARFPHTKSFDTFDFAAQPSLNKALVLELARGEWIERQRNVIALGPAVPARPTPPSRWDWPLARRGTAWPSPPLRRWSMT
jgi:hypothetical protein